MSVEVKVFEHAAFGRLRIFMRGGEDRFAMKDVCKMLGINRFDAWNALDEGRKDIAYREVQGVTHATLITDSDGLDQLIAVSSHPCKEEMRGWIRDSLRSSKSCTTGAVRHFQLMRMYKVGVVIHEREPWFIARDVFNVLGIVGNRCEIMDIVANEDKALVEADDNGFPVKLSVISVNGLRALEEQGKMLKGCSCSD